MTFQRDHLPGSPDFHTGRAANDQAGLSPKELVERSATLATKLEQALTRASRVESEAYELRQQNQRQDAQIADLKQRIARMKQVGVVEIARTENEPDAVADAAAFAKDPLHPQRFRGGRVPRVLAMISAHPGASMGQLSDLLGISYQAVANSVSAHSQFIEKRPGKNCNHLYIKTGGDHD